MSSKHDVWRYNFRYASHPSRTTTKFPLKFPMHSLLDLPTEIRLEIWKYVLRPQTVIRPVQRFGTPAIPPHDTHALALLKTSRQTRNECISVFYGAKNVHLGGSHHVFKWLGRIGPAARSHVSKLEFTVQKWRYVSSAGGLGGEEGSWAGGDELAIMDLLATCVSLRELKITFAEDALVKSYVKMRAKYIGREAAEKEWRAKERNRMREMGWLGRLLPGFRELMALKGLQVLQVTLWPRCVNVRDEARRELKSMLKGCMAPSREGGLQVFSERGGALWEIDRA